MDIPVPPVNEEIVEVVLGDTDESKNRGVGSATAPERSHENVKQTVAFPVPQIKGKIAEVFQALPKNFDGKAEADDKGGVGRWR